MVLMPPFLDLELPLKLCTTLERFSGSGSLCNGSPTGVVAFATPHIFRPRLQQSQGFYTPRVPQTARPCERALKSHGRNKGNYSFDSKSALKFLHCSGGGSVSGGVVEHVDVLYHRVSERCALKRVILCLLCPYLMH